MMRDCSNVPISTCLLTISFTLLVLLLEHGARVAWRNAPKCSNRKYWQQLKLLDCRDVNSNKGIYGSCMKHLTKAVACGSAEAYVTVFRPSTPGTCDGPAIWNEQLLSYAAYNQQGEIVGDPKNVSFATSSLFTLQFIFSHLSYFYFSCDSLKCSRKGLDGKVPQMGHKGPMITYP